MIHLQSATSLKYPEPDTCRFIQTSHVIPGRQAKEQLVFKFFGMGWPGIEHTTPRTQDGRSSKLATAPVDS